MTLPGKAVIIIDGYNAIHRAPLLKKQLDKSLEAARDTLTALCAEWRASRGDVLSIQLVFDGQSRLPEIPSLPRQGVQVSFSRKPQSADEHILALLRNIADAAACVVVSDDREIIRHAVRLGAQPMGARPGIGRWSQGIAHARAGAPHQRRADPQVGIGIASPD
jgi:predicted RNA-binding protein with PIN domain